MSQIRALQLQRKDLSFPQLTNSRGTYFPERIKEGDVSYFHPPVVKIICSYKKISEKYIISLTLNMHIGGIISTI